MVLLVRLLLMLVDWLILMLIGSMIVWLIVMLDIMISITSEASNCYILIIVKEA